MRCLTNLATIAIRESFNTESLLFRIKRYQLRWFGHASRMPHERNPKQNLNFICENEGKRPIIRPWTKWLDYIVDLGWNRLGLHSSEMQFVLEDRENWRLNLELLSLQLSRNNGWRKKKEQEGKEEGIKLHVQYTYTKIFHTCHKNICKQFD